MSAAAREKMTVDEYLALERRSDRKHEFFDGEAWMMAGGSPRHSFLAANIIGALKARLRGSRCAAYTSDAMVHVAATGLFTYPDVTVVCGGSEYHPTEPNAITNPRVIFEVLSHSTEAWDRGPKFQNYSSIPTLAEYVLVSQREPGVTHFRRAEGGQWSLIDPGPEGLLRFTSLGCEIPVAEIYEDYLDHRGDEPSGSEPTR